jgi:transposase InsO family protein
MAWIFRDRVWHDFGLPERIISDHGPQFASTFTRDLNKLLDIQSNLSTAYHPQTDGQTERVNQEVEQYLHLFVNYHQSDWSEWLPLAEFSYNDKLQSSTGYSPFYLNYGQHPRMAYNPHARTQNDSAETFATHMQRIRDDANSALVKSTAAMKRFYDRSHSTSPNYQLGDKVWLEAMNLKTLRPCKKLDDKRFGPFKVLHCVGQ